MSNLFKSKFLLGVAIVAVMFVGAAVINTPTAAADSCTITKTLRLGSKGDEVKCLQTALGVKADGKFGKGTKVAVIAWQKAAGLVADGVFGKKSNAVLVAGGTVSSGGPVSSGGFTPEGCTSASGFSPVTGGACKAVSSTTTPPPTTTTLPAGCTSTSGFSSTTGAKCDSTGGTVVTSGSLTATLASDNPATGTIVAGQATADLAHFTFTGNGTVTAVTLQRIGVSADSTPSNVYLFDGATRLTDAASVSTGGMVSFSVPSGIFTVTGSKTIAVKSDIAASTSGQTLGFMLSTFKVGDGPVTANLSGNVFTIASATLATVSAGTVTPSGATLNPGPAITVWQSTLSISNRDVKMKRLALRNVGSAPATAFQNFKLYVNGVQVGSATGLDINGYVTFDLSSAPVLLVAGSRVVRVDVDIVSGASRTVQFSLRQAADVDFVDSSFGVNISVNSPTTTTPWVGSTASTISGTGGGTLTVEKDVSSPSTNLTLNGSDVNLGTFKLTAYGESIKVETLTAGGTFNGTLGTPSDAAVTLRNGHILIGGVQYGSTATLVPAGTSFTTNYTVVPGTPVLVEVHADVFDNDGVGALAASDTILATLKTGSSNADRVDSLGSFNVPGSDVSANTLTIATTAVTLSKNATYANQNTTLPSTNFKIGSYTVAGSSVEDVLLTTVTVDVNAVSGLNFTAGDVKNLYVVAKDGSGKVVAQPAPIGTVVAAANSFSINYTLPKNQNMSIDVFGNLSDDGLPSAIVAGNSMATTVQISGTSMVSGQTVSSGVHSSNTVLGQTIAFNASSITVSKDASSPVTGITYDAQTIMPITTLAAKFAAVTSDYKVTDLTVTLGTNANTVVQKVMLYDGTTLIGSGPMTTTTTAVFSGLAWNVPANTNKILTVKLQLGTIGVGGGTTGSTITTSIANATDFTATNLSTGVSATGAGTATGSNMYAFASTPTIAQVALASNSLTNTNSLPLLRFSVTANGGDIGWDQIAFKVIKDSQTTVGTNATTGISLWDVTAGGNTSVAGTFSNGTSVTSAGTCSTYTNTTCQIIFIPTAEQSVSGTAAKTYELRGNIAAATTKGDFVNVTIDNNNTSIVASGSVAAKVAAAVDQPFIWSDLSAASHDTTTSDWTVDFGVKNLPVSNTLTSPL